MLRARDDRDVPSGSHIVWRHRGNPYGTHAAYAPSGRTAMI